MTTTSPLRAPDQEPDRDPDGADRDDASAEEPDGVSGDGSSEESGDERSDEGTGDAGAGGHRALEYNPALDGIRGLAVGAVLFFHGGFSWARGGYLGVSTFFTLSGFLITSLLLVEHRRSGRIRLTAFWARRLRRLLPASAATLAGLLVTMVAIDNLWGPELPGDVIACALQVANWHFLWEDRSYGELFAAPSPALHFWSLAIEEQFYWVFPLVAAGLLRFGRRVFTGALVLLLAGSAVLTAVSTDAPDTVYYSTPIRMGEILVGCLLAVAVTRRPARVAGEGEPGSAEVAGDAHADADEAGETGEGAPGPSRVVTWGAGLVGLVALVVSVWAWANVQQTSEALSRGWLLGYAVASGALVLGATVPGPFRRFLSFPPLRLLGLVSYGVYLFHWPLFLFITPQRLDDWFGWRPDPEGWPLFGVRIATTLVAAAVSYVLLEQPIRRGRFLRRPASPPTGWARWPRRLVAAPTVALGTVTAVVVAALLVPEDAALERTDQFETAAEQLANLDSELLAAAEAEIAERRAAVPQEAVDVMFFGDSAALTVAAGVGEWGLQSKQLLLQGDGATTQVGCGIGRGGERRQFGEASPVPEGCPRWDRDWPREVDEQPGTQIGVILTGSWDVIDRKLPGDDEWRGLGDPVYDRYLRAEIRGATEVLLDKGLRVVWLTTPPLDFGRSRVPRPDPDPPDTLERIDRLNRLIREVAEELPGTTVVDFGGHFAAMPPAENDRLRPDGVHVDLERSLEVAQWLAPAILTAAEEAAVELVEAQSSAP
ncbi:MAG TPA: acyltransferase family protein [Acidimicrobiales bacterium]